MANRLALYHRILDVSTAPVFWTLHQKEFEKIFFRKNTAGQVRIADRTPEESLHKRSKSILQAILFQYCRIISIRNNFLISFAASVLKITHEKCKKKEKFSLKNNKIIIINRLLDQDNQAPKIQTKPGTKRKGKMGKKKAQKEKGWVAGITALGLEINTSDVGELRSQRPG